LEEGLGCVLGDEMGLGKTVQVIAALAKDREQNSGPTLIVCPTTLIENWRREYARFDPTANVLVHAGPHRAGRKDDLERSDIVLVSYETAVRDVALLEDVDWRSVVADEAQAIKNPQSERSRALKRLRRSSSIAMTGTPVENSLRDLWSLFDFAVPGYLGPLPDFESQYSNSEDDAVQLGPVVRPLILRRLVRDVATDLPERIEIVEALELGPSAPEYERLRIRLIQEENPMTALLRLRMFCAHPNLLTPSTNDPSSNSTKFGRLLEIIESIVACEEKILVFAPFQEILTMIATEVERRFRVFSGVLDGRAAVSLRQGLVDEFSAQTGPAVLALNPRSGGTGLNIAAANHVIHYAMEWNPAVEDQATARAHRRGQQRPVTVRKLFYVNTVEEYVASVGQAKRVLAAGAVIGTAGHEAEVGAVARALSLSPLEEKSNE
jgi:SNF2 family DNA or RNA helicase